MLKIVGQTPRTLHDYPNIVQKTMDNLQGLEGGHVSLFLGQPIQPVQHSLDLNLS
jgi:hypothetical protein